MSSEEVHIKVTLLHGTLGNLCREGSIQACETFCLHNWAGRVVLGSSYLLKWRLWRKASWLVVMGDARSSPSSLGDDFLWVCSCFALMLQACLCVLCPSCILQNTWMWLSICFLTGKGSFVCSSPLNSVCLTLHFKVHYYVQPGTCWNTVHLGVKVKAWYELIQDADSLWHLE